MKVVFISPFTDLLKAFNSESILYRAQNKGVVEYHYINLFECSDLSQNSIDDYPYGGGSGMILRPEPVFNAYSKALEITGKDNVRVLFPTPDGNVLNQEISKNLSNTKNLIFICGHYKNIDQRIRDVLITDEISIGDYVLTGGELPACVILDSVVRLMPGVLGNIDSANSDSFSDDLLDCPHYTRPEVYKDIKVPEVLTSGNHKKIEEWKLNKREEKTKLRRPDLYKIYSKKKD